MTMAGKGSRGAGRYSVLFGTALALAGLCGCVPYPHYRYYAPNVTGIVLDDGAPVANASVKLTDTLSSESAVSATDSDGRFTLPALRQLQGFASLIGDPFTNFTVVIVRGDTEYRGYVESRVGYAPKSLRLSCDLATPQPHIRSFSVYRVATEDAT